MSTLHTRGYRPSPGERALSYFDDHEDHWYSPREAWAEVWAWARDAKVSWCLPRWLAESEVSEDRLADACLDARDAVDPLVLAHCTRLVEATTRDLEALR